MVTEQDGSESETSSDIRIGPGDNIVWKIGSGPHGLEFPNFAAAKRVLDFGADLPSLESKKGKTMELNEQGNFASAKVKPDFLESKIANVGFQCLVHRTEMQGSLIIQRVDPNVDPIGQIFALREDVPAIMEGLKPAEPLVIRASTGDVVDITLTSALRDDGEAKFENEGYSKVGIHTHLVQYDVQSSDGAVAGLNYETSIRPSLKWDRDSGTLKEIVGEGENGAEEQVHYRWWCDVELGTVYWHDHSLLKNSLPHGLFGATIVEPYDAEYYDPETGKALYMAKASDEPDAVSNTILNSTSGRGGTAVVDIRFPSDSETKSFREFVPLFGDGRAHSSDSINLRKNPLSRRNLDRRDLTTLKEFGEIHKRETQIRRAEVGDPFELSYGNESLFSSLFGGDPVTPLWRAFGGDPVRIRVEGGSTNEIHLLNLHGNRWAHEWNNPNATLRDFGLVGVSEAFSFVLDSRIGNEPGDYLYSSPGRDTLVDGGKWGIMRVYPKENEAREGATARGHILVQLEYKNPQDIEEIVVRANTIFISEHGNRFVVPEQQIFGREQINPTVSSDPNNTNPTYSFEIAVRAAHNGEESNEPAHTFFATDNPKDLGENIDIKRIWNIQSFVDGKSALQPLPTAFAIAPDTDDEPQTPTIASLHVAALQVNLPIPIAKESPVAKETPKVLIRATTHDGNFVWEIDDDNVTPNLIAKAQVGDFESRPLRQAPRAAWEEGGTRTRTQRI